MRTVLRRGVLVRCFSAGSRAGSGVVVRPAADRVVEVCMQAPPVNTFTRPVLEEFTATLAGLEADPGVDGLVLTSGCPNVFSAGLDLNEMHAPHRADFCEYWTMFEKMWKAYYMSPLVTCAAVNGNCPALGAVLALSSDLRLMANNDRFRIGLNETSLGMNPPVWLRKLCERTLGARNAELHLQASTMATPSQAVELGYVDALVSVPGDGVGDDRMLQVALEKMSPLLEVPAKARAQTKMGFRADVAAEADHSASVETMAESVTGAEFQETVSGILSAMKQRRRAAKQNS